MKKSISLFIICILSISLISCAKLSKKPGTEQDKQEAGKNIPKPEDMIIDPAAWKEKYPMIYESFIRTSRMGDGTKEDSNLGGMHPIDYLKKYPNIAILYEGMGFAKEYYKARGHFYALEDVIKITRPKPGASCLACKSGEYEKLHAKHGDALFAMDFNAVAQDVKFGITCYNCHRNNPEKGVQVVSPHFAKKVDKLGMELKPGTKACAQCHVEYYFDKQTKEVVLPWDKGIGVNEIEAYFDEKGYVDWTHPRTGTPMLKVQHPEFEMYTGSVHDNAKLSCADCHMPTVTENGQKYKSHWAKSPLKTVEESCGKCHGSGKELEELVVTVQAIQKYTERIEVEVSDMLVKLTKDLGSAIEKGKLDEPTLKKLQVLHRKAQYRWDFVFVENSTGFHNEKKSIDTLNQAKAYAKEALDILEGLK